MVKKNYQAKLKDSKKIAKAIAKNQRASLKFSTEIVREIKGKRVDSVEKFLQRILEKKEWLPLRRYKKKTGHKKGSAKSFTKIGGTPVGTVRVFLNLLNTVKANADYKGLDADNLIITHVFASQGFRRYSSQSQGRTAGKRRRRKSVHLEIAVVEAK